MLLSLTFKINDSPSLIILHPQGNVRAFMRVWEEACEESFSGPRE